MEDRGARGLAMSDADSLRWRTSLAELETTATNVSADDVPELAGRLEALKVRVVPWPPPRPRP
jgi:hypothetical protein